MDIAAELRDLARNLWWCWHTEAIAMFRDLDPNLWRKVNHNPVAFLDAIEQEHLKQRAADLVLETRVSYAFHRLHEYMAQKHTWGSTYAGSLKVSPVAYFSAEFGIGGRSPEKRCGLGGPDRRDGPALRPRLLQSAPRPVRLAAGELQRDPRQQSARGADAGPWGQTPTRVR